MAEYAVCATTYQCAPRLDASIRSILEATAGLDVEWRVVDNHSRDGTWEQLQAWAGRIPRFEAVQRRCNRGRGRQLAFEASTAPYVIRVDLDTVYLPVVGELLRRHRGWSGRDQWAVATRYMDVAPRAVLERVGGWRPLNYMEDVDLWHRLRRERALASLSALPVGQNWDVPDPERRQERRLLPYAWRHFRNTRDHFRAAGGTTLRSKVGQEARRTRHPVRFWAAAAPMMALAWLSQAHERKQPPAPEDGERRLTLDDLLA